MYSAGGSLVEVPARAPPNPGRRRAAKLRISAPARMSAQEAVAHAAVANDAAVYETRSIDSNTGFWLVGREVSEFRT